VSTLIGSRPLGLAFAFACLSFPEVTRAEEAPPPVSASTASGSPSLSDLLEAAAGTPRTALAILQGPGQASSALGRAFQSLNPDISVIVDATAGYGDRAPYRLAGDDPDLKGGPNTAAAGVTVQEAEVAFQAIVDPYFRGDVFLTIPNLAGLEVEEAFVTATALPFDLQLKAGAFRSAFGRQNGQHLHLQDFTRRPLINAAYLGTDGLRAPGAQLSWLAPAPFFIQINLEAFSVGPPDDRTQLSSFGGGPPTDLTYAIELKTFAPIGESVSIYGGLNTAIGRSPGLVADNGTEQLSGARSRLYGADLYVKYKPPNVVDGYFNLAWTTEYIFRTLGSGPTALGDGGFYSQLVVQVARRWLVGVRQDVLGLPTSSVQPRVYRTSGSLTFVTSEFARLRLYGEREIVSGAPDRSAGYLQLEIAMGAHGAHPF
jgi:hypothetical protein